LDAWLEARKSTDGEEESAGGEEESTGGEEEKGNTP